jgi:CO/xanthine dehydrogenase Mo-binding subunit
VGQPVALVLAESPAAATAGAAAVALAATARPDEPGPESPAELPPDDDPRWLPELTQSVGDDLPSAVDTVDTVDAADTVEVTGEFWVPRTTAMPLETRGLLAEVADGRLTVHGVTKHPAANRVAVAAMTGVPEHRVEFPRGDVGGSFGVKGELYPEDLLIPWAAVHTGLPVRWIEDRAEHVVATNHSRGQAWRVRLTADRAGRLLAADVTIVSDGGAFVRPLTSLVPYLASAMFPGPYRLPRYRARVRQLLTTRTPIGTVRAPGRFEANTVREHMLDRLACELGIDPDELRLRNLLAQQDMPHDAGTLNEGPVHYDTGDFRAAFEDGLRRAPAPPEPGDGLRRATATVPFVDKAGLGGDERAVATLLPDRTVRVTVACAPSGQSHQTMLAEVAATELGMDRSRIQVCFDDGNHNGNHDGNHNGNHDGHGNRDGNGAGAGGRDGPRSIGTFASRTAAHTGNAVLLAIRALAAAVREAAGADANEPFASVATRAAAPVSVTRGYDTTAHTYPYGAVTCAIAVDPDLLTVRVEHLAISCDAGRPVHEPTVRGQLAGGLVMGVSAALLEQLTYRSGQPECTGLAGYPLALSSDVPDVDVVLLEPAPRTALSAPNPLGVKGIGEAGTAAAGAAVVAAVCRALPHLTATLDRLPLTPSVLLAAARENADLLGAAAAR